MIIFFLFAILSTQSSFPKRYAQLNDKNKIPPKAKLLDENNDKNEEEADDDDDPLNFIFLIAIAVGGLVLVVLLIVLVVLIAKMSKRNGTHHGKCQVESTRESLLGNRDKTGRPESHSSYIRPDSSADFMRPDSNAALARPDSSADFVRPDTAIVMPESSLEILESSSISSVDMD